MPEHHERIARTALLRFSAAADTYDRNAVVQRRAARKVADLLDGLPTPARILEAGCGTGLLTQLLVERYPRAELDAVDASERMIARSRARVGRAGRVNWVVSDLARLNRPRAYALVASSSALHWAEPFAAAIEQLVRCLDRNGHLVFSLMLDGTLRELHECRGRAAPSKPALGHLPRLAEVVDALSAAGAEVAVATEETETEWHPDARGLLRALHETGLTGGAVSRGPAPLCRREIAGLIADYDTRFRNASGQVPASYVVAYVRARVK
jgi:malonyl-ACP O-methyltransferase BioC